MTGRLTIYILLVLTTALSAAAGIRHPGLLFTPEKVEAAKAREYPDGSETDASIIYAGCYYLEALERLAKKQQCN